MHLAAERSNICPVLYGLTAKALSSMLAVQVQPISCNLLWCSVPLQRTLNAIHVSLTISSLQQNTLYLKYYCCILPLPTLPFPSCINGTPSLRSDRFSYGFLFPNSPSRLRGSEASGPACAFRTASAARSFTKLPLISKGHCTTPTEAYAVTNAITAIT